MIAATVCLHVRTSFIALDCVWLQHDSDYDRDLGLALRHAMPPGEWLAIVDAGTVPYYADVPTHDVLWDAPELANNHGQEGPGWGVRNARQ